MFAFRLKERHLKGVLAKQNVLTHSEYTFKYFLAILFIHFLLQVKVFGTLQVNIVGGRGQQKKLLCNVAEMI